MTSFTDFVSVVHSVYRDAGGTYPEEQTAQEIMVVAGDLWQRNTEYLRNTPTNTVRSQQRDVILQQLDEAGVRA